MVRTRRHEFLLISIVFGLATSLSAQAEFRWTGPQGNVCGNFGKNTLLSTTENEKCLTPDLTYFQWSYKHPDVCIAYSSCGTDLGTVDKSHCSGRTNYFSHNWPMQGFTWENCITPKQGEKLASGPDDWEKTAPHGGTTAPFDLNGNFVPECAPDVLYSWRMPQYIQEYKERASPSHPLDWGTAKRGIFTWRTPVGSFGYGRSPIRIKLRSDVKFVLISKDFREGAFPDRDCSILKAKYGTNVVYVGREGYTYSEYQLCSDEPIESWSHSTPPHYQEILNEKKWISEHETDFRFDNLNRPNSLLAGGVPWKTEIDRGKNRNWTLDSLNHDLTVMKEEAEATGGKVYFRQGAVPSLWNHFATKTPGYFNSHDIRVAKEDWKERRPDGCAIRTLTIVNATCHDPKNTDLNKLGNSIKGKMDCVSGVDP